MARAIASITLTVALALAGCAATPTCVPNATQRCDCSASLTGVQFCTGTGVWSVCDCTPRDAGPDATHADAGSDASAHDVGPDVLTMDAAVDGASLDIGVDVGNDVGLDVGNDVGVDGGRPECDLSGYPPVTLIPVTDHLFEAPVFVTQPPGSSDLYVVERAGRVVIVRPDGTVLPTPFLDVTATIAWDTSSTERGLLGLAFHPDYVTNGRFFVTYTVVRTLAPNVLAEGRRSAADPDVAEPSVTELLSIPDTGPSHNGGMIEFGPDGYLYLSDGDGGGPADPYRTAQSLDRLLGKILRLDVDHGSPYSVPADNPFRDVPGARGEIWAWGLRNPWRFSIDRETGDLWIGDVGELAFEEIDLAPRGVGGLNFGWSAYEGDAPFTGADTAHSAVVRPVYPYGHMALGGAIRGGAAVVGGYVYRGSAIPGLRGAYVFGDFVSVDIGAFRYCDGATRQIAVLMDLVGVAPGLTSFGEDQAGELYTIGFDRRLRRLVPR